MERPVLKNKAGLTLLELVIAISIMFIVFLGLTGTVLTAMEYNIRNALLDEAVSVGETRMNEIRSLPFNSIVTPGGPETVTKQVRKFNAVYTVTTTVTDPATDIKQVTMVVTWTRLGTARSHTFSSIVRRRP